MSDGRAQISQLAFGFDSRGWFRRGIAYFLFVGLPIVTAAALIGPTPYQRLAGLATFYLPIVVTLATGKTWPMFAGYGGSIAGLIFFARTEVIQMAGLYYWPALAASLLCWLFWSSIYSHQKYWEFTDSAAEAVKEAFKKGPASITINDNDGQQPRKPVSEFGATRGDADPIIPEWQADLLRKESNDFDPALSGEAEPTEAWWARLKKETMKTPKTKKKP